MTYQERLLKIKQGELPKECVPKKRKPLKKISDKLKTEREKNRVALGGEDTELVKWFKQKIKTSSGYCSECGCRVEKNVYQFAVMTVCHILAKRPTVCPSVKTHPLNFIILCPDHHDMFDKSSWEEREMMGCWETVKQRLVMLYDSIADNEKRHFPSFLLKEMKGYEPF